MEVGLIFKIAAVGILVTILSQVLKHSGREEHAFLLSLAALAFIFTESQEKRFPGRKPMKKKRWSFWKKKKQRNGNRINQDRYGVSVLFSCRDLFLSENKSL